MRRVRDIEEGGFPEAFQESNKRVQSLSLAVLDRPFLKGSNPDGVRTLVGAPPPLVPRARVQMRIPGETRIYLHFRMLYRFIFGILSNKGE